MIELQKVYWPDAKRPFQPIDIEYLSCECRKYYSYVNGTKAYEGKNIFKPGKSPMLPFEMPIDLKNKIQKTKVYVIAGICTQKYFHAGKKCNFYKHFRRTLFRKDIGNPVSEEQRLPNHSRDC